MIYTIPSGEDCACDCTVEFPECGTVDMWMPSDITPGTFDFPGNVVPPSWTHVGGPGILASDGTWIYPTATTIYHTGIIGRTFDISFIGKLQGGSSSFYASDIHLSLALKSPSAGYITAIVPGGVDPSDPNYPNQLGVWGACDIDDLIINSDIESVPDDIQNDTEYNFSITRNDSSIVLSSATASINHTIQAGLGAMELVVAFWQQFSESPRIRNLTVIAT